MPTVKTMVVSLQPQCFKSSDIPRLRAFLANRFPEYQQIHNHKEEGRFSYVYPELQFKFINGKPVIVGYNSGLEILKKVFLEIGYLEINHRKIEVSEKSITLKEQDLGMNDDFIRYQFVTPWMALNQQNYQAFKMLNTYEREMKLNQILWGNLRTLAHAFNYWIPDQDQLKVNGHFTMKSGTFKGNTMLLFQGDFVTNFCIPDYLGLGKQVARGYGAVNRI